MRVCVCIPTFENPRTIAAVMRDCLASVPVPLLVIDDGSTVPVRSIAEADPHIHEALQMGRCYIHRLPRNEGKGTALRTAFRLAAEDHFTHLLTLDGDGQHFPGDLPGLIQRAVERPGSFVIGRRDMRAASAPWLSRIGRRLADAWIYLNFRVTVGDSQCGVRLYPIEPVLKGPFRTTAYDFELEVLWRLLHQGVRCEVVPVRVLYQKRGERVSHFSKLRDNLRIAALAARLSLERRLWRLAPWEIS